MRPATLIAIVLVVFCTNAVAQHNDPKQPTAEPVITLDFQGSRLKRIDDSPTLSVYADGRVVMPQIYAHTRAYSGQISQAELQDLLDFVVSQQRFFAYDQEKAAKQLRQRTGPVETLPAHLATTVIRVNANSRSKTVSYYGLGNEPTVPETEPLLAIRTRLEQLMAVMKLGGSQEASRWLALANRELHSRDPGAIPLQLTDLRSAAIHHDGSAFVRFARVAPAKDSSVSVSISMNESGESSIAVAQDDLLSRPAHQIH